MSIANKKDKQILYFYFLLEITWYFYPVSNQHLITVHLNFVMSLFDENLCHWRILIQINLFFNQYPFFYFHCFVILHCRNIFNIIYNYNAILCYLLLLQLKEYAFHKKIFYFYVFNDCNHLFLLLFHLHSIEWKLRVS